MTSLGENVAIAGYSRGTATIPQAATIIESKAEITQILSDWQVPRSSRQLSNRQNWSSCHFVDGEQVTSEQQRLEAAYGTARFCAGLFSRRRSANNRQLPRRHDESRPHTRNVDGPNFAMGPACFWPLSAAAPPPSSTVTPR
jgi:hypothetical protein